jgi:exopolysaccharide biosynthesis protein
MKKILSVFIGLFFLLCNSGFAGEIVDLIPEHPGILFCWTETQSGPRPLKIRFLMIDLTSEDLEVITLPGEDPDGNGPAESQLTSPAVLFNKYKAVAAVNANAFSGIGKNESSHTVWYKGQPVDMHGMVVSRGKTISPAETGRSAFWLDKDRKPHIGNPAAGASVTEAVADWFSPLIINSKIIPDASDQAVHPRTALGFDESGKWLLLVVVDGRQPGYSEGISLYDLAKILEAKGCTQSVNLDGGGSSIMLIRDRDNRLRSLNRPSDGEYRPVPVMLGIRKK